MVSTSLKVFFFCSNWLIRKPYMQSTLHLQALLYPLFRLILLNYYQSGSCILNVIHQMQNSRWNSKSNSFLFPVLRCLGSTDTHMNQMGGPIHSSDSLLCPCKTEIVIWEACCTASEQCHRTYFKLYLLLDFKPKVECKFSLVLKNRFTKVSIDDQWWKPSLP